GGIRLQCTRCAPPVQSPNRHSVCCSQIIRPLRSSGRSLHGEDIMADQRTEGGTARADGPGAAGGESRVTREELIAHLNEDLAREYQAIIAYVVYSQVLKGAQYMSIATELEKHAHEELAHALIISK